MTRPYLSQPMELSIPGITRHQADTAYINNEEHATFTDNINMSNHKITNLSDGVTNNDAVNKKQLDALSSLIFQPDTIKVIKRFSTGRFQNLLKSQLLFTDTFYYAIVIDCYVETFAINQRDIKWINIKAQPMEQYKCEIKIKRTYSSTPVESAILILESMLDYKFYLEVGNDFDIPRGSYNDIQRQYWCCYICYVDQQSS